jgi:hypothetical protein
MTRDLSFDVLRGLMLIIMATDHFGEPIEKYTWEMFGFVSAAEGFVFLSGILVGLVYSRYLDCEKWQLEHKIWQRAKLIYIYHLVTLLFVWSFTVLGDLLGAHWSTFAKGMLNAPLTSLSLGFVLLYLPPMLDILPIYIVLMVIAPLMLRLFQRDKAVWVFSISLLIWGLAQFDVQKLIWKTLPGHEWMRAGAFDLFGWQLIFVLGVYIGYRRYQAAQIEPLDTKSKNSRLVYLFAAVFFIVIFLFLLRHGHIKTGWLENYVNVDRESIAWLRLLNFLALVFLIYGLILLQKSYGIFNGVWFAGRWLAFLGQHSLQVFSYHLIVLYAYIPFRWGAWALSDAQKVIALVLFLASLSLPAWLHSRYQLRKARKVVKLK